MRLGTATASGGKRATPGVADSDLPELCAFFAAARSRGERLVLATILRTEGSTYRKAGAQILIAESGASSGLLSGGCLENALRERAMRVLACGRPERAFFDTRGADDPIFGLQAGCEGANDIWLQPATNDNDYASLSYLAGCLEATRAGRVATVVGGNALAEELGRQSCGGACGDDPLSMQLSAIEADRPTLTMLEHAGRMLEVFIAPVMLPPALLLCGGGPDARPVAQFAAALGWRVTVYDHRPAFATADYFPSPIRVILGRAEQLLEHLQPGRFDAVVIMSHHLPADIEYLRGLTLAPPHFIGVLGPAARRARLFAEVGRAVQPLVDRIHGPVGLDIGARTPASIALSIVAEIHAALEGRGGAALAAPLTPSAMPGR